jgi:hypothetical protein
MDLDLAPWHYPCLQYAINIACTLHCMKMASLVFSVRKVLMLLCTFLLPLLTSAGKLQPLGKLTTQNSHIGLMDKVKSPPLMTSNHLVWRNRASQDWFRKLLRLR